MLKPATPKLFFSLLLLYQLVAQSAVKEFHQQDIETITLLLAKISQRTPDEIKPHLDIMLEQLVPTVQEPMDTNGKLESK